MEILLDVTIDIIATLQVNACHTCTDAKRPHRDQPVESNIPSVTTPSHKALTPTVSHTP